MPRSDEATTREGWIWEVEGGGSNFTACNGLLQPSRAGSAVHGPRAPPTARRRRGREKRRGRGTLPLSGIHYTISEAANNWSIGNRVHKTRSIVAFIFVKNRSISQTVFDSSTSTTVPSSVLSKNDRLMELDGPLFPIFEKPIWFPAVR